MLGWYIDLKRKLIAVRYSKKQANVGRRWLIYTVVDIKQYKLVRSAVSRDLSTGPRKRAEFQV